MLAALRSRLWFRLVGVFLLASVVPLIGAGWITAGLLEERARSDADQQLRSLANLGESLVDGWIARGQGKLSTVGRLLGERTTGVAPQIASNFAFRDKVIDNVNGLVEPADLYLDIHFYNNRANPELVSQVATVEVERAQQLTPDFEAVQSRANDFNINNALVNTPLNTGEPVVSPVVNEHFGFPALQVSAPVSQNERPSGALVAYLDIRVLEELLHPVASDTRRIELLDREGKTVVAIGEKTAFEHSVVEPVEEFGWTFTIAEPRDLALAAAREVRTQAIRWTGVAIAIAIVLSFLCAAWLVRPIRTLTGAANRMESGDLGARVELQRGDEIGKLGNAFDKMAAALEKLDSAKSSFLGTVSHELRTPLTSMQMSLANVLDGVVGDIEPRQRQALERVATGIQRLERMVRDALALARLEAGAESVALVECELAAVARDAASTLAPIAESRQITIEVTGTGRALADPEQLHRMLVNLLDNAVKFSPDGGTVTVDIDGASLCVTDQGPGFTVENPFAAFVQGERDGVKNPGSGLGLSIVRHLVELHGGNIRVEQRQGGVVRLDLQKP